MVHAIEAALGTDIKADRLDDGRDQEGGARPSCTPSPTRSAIRIAGATTRRCASSAATRYGNSQRANAFEFRRQLAKIGKPVDKTEWLMTPPTVNAYYNPLENNINFPAGILQPPFFIKAADDAVNFGARRRGDRPRADARLRRPGPPASTRRATCANWWTPADGKAFEERAACVVEQYGGYTAVDDVKLNGKLTLGENVADNGGVRLALMALMEHAEDEASSARADGFTPEQRFFLGWGQMWCENRSRRDRPAARADQPAFARPVPDQRRGVEHAGVPEGVLLPGDRQDGAAAGLPRLVSYVCVYGWQFGLPGRGFTVRRTSDKPNCKPNCKPEAL